MFSDRRHALGHAPGSEQDQEDQQYTQRSHAFYHQQRIRAHAGFFRTTSITVTSGVARKRMGGPQVPVPRLV